MLKRLVGSALIALLMATLPALAQPQAPNPSPESANQAWPQRTVKLILPIGPGSGADIGARLMADRLSKAWSQPVVVENRPGGDSMVAIGAFLGADDGHTFLWGPSSTFTAHPYLHAKLPYDPKELLPLVRFSNTVVSVVVPADLGVTSLPDLVRLIKAEPGKLNWAAVTGINDFLFQSFVKSSELSISRVPYRDGVQALNDVSEGRIQVYSAAYAITRPQVEAGKVRVIAIANTTRAAMLPGIPTARESGYPAIEFDGLVGLYGRPGTPQIVKDKLAGDIKAITTDPVIVDRLAATGQIINFGASVDFIASVNRQREVAAAAAKLLGLTAAP